LNFRHPENRYAAPGLHARRHLGNIQHENEAGSNSQINSATSKEFPMGIFRDSSRINDGGSEMA